MESAATLQRAAWSSASLMWYAFAESWSSTLRSNGVARLPCKSHLCSLAGANCAPIINAATAGGNTARERAASTCGRTRSTRSQTHDPGEVGLQSVATRSHARSFMLTCDKQPGNNMGHVTVLMGPEVPEPPVGSFRDHCSASHRISLGTHCWHVHRTHARQRSDKSAW
jgi:hypothetical protein